MEQISDPLECNVVGIQGVEICCPANAIGISKFFEYANSNCPQPEGRNVNVDQEGSDNPHHKALTRQPGRQGKQEKENMKRKERRKEREKKEERRKKKGAYKEGPI